MWQNHTSLDVACTDVTNSGDIPFRLQAYAQAGCNAVLADVRNNSGLLAQLQQVLNYPVFYNVIDGGKVPTACKSDLAQCGVQGLNISTPYLFPTREAIEQVLHQLPHAGESVACAGDLSHCHALLQANLEQTGKHD